MRKIVWINKLCWALTDCAFAERSGDNEKARDAWEQACDLHSCGGISQKALFGIKRAAAERGDYREAFFWARGAIQLALEVEAVRLRQVEINQRRQRILLRMADRIHRGNFNKRFRYAAIRRAGLDVARCRELGLV